MNDKRLNQKKNVRVDAVSLFPTDQQRPKPKEQLVVMSKDTPGKTENCQKIQNVN